MIPNPYTMGAQVAVLLVLLSTVAVQCQAIKAAKTATAAAEARTEYALEDLADAKASLEAERENRAWSEHLVTLEAERVAFLEPKYETLLNEVNRATPPIPLACQSVLDSLRDAVNGLRLIQDVPAAEDGGATTTSRAADVRRQGDQAHE